MIEQLHTGSHPLVIAITGGGSVAISDLLQVPGASRTVLEAVVPYSASALTNWLGHHPDQFCSRDTALMMAAAAWSKARQYALHEGRDPESCLGVGCTASLATQRAHRGEHRCFIAVESAAGSRLVSLVFDKGHRDRRAEEEIVAQLVLYAITQSVGLDSHPLLGLDSNETIMDEVVQPDPSILAVRSGQSPVAWSNPDGTVTPVAAERPVGLVSGSFNPLHRGHTGLRQVAEDLLEGLVAYELPVINADKPPIDCFSIEQRRGQFREYPVALTGAPLFLDKSRLFPGTTFVVGCDTASRIIDPRFYPDGAAGLHAALDTIRNNNCSFLVAGRQTGDRFETLADLLVPDDSRDLFQEIPDERFRDDVSATQIRQARLGSSQ